MAQILVPHAFPGDGRTLPERYISVGLCRAYMARIARSSTKEDYLSQRAQNEADYQPPEVLIKVQYSCGRSVLMEDGVPLKELRKIMRGWHGDCPQAPAVAAGPSGAEANPAQPEGGAGVEPGTVGGTPPPDLREPDPRDPLIGA